MLEQATTNTQSATQTTETTQSSAPVAATEVSSTVSTPTTRYIDSLDAKFKDIKSLQSIKDANDLAERFINAQQLVGKKAEEFAAKDLKAVYTKLGAPETEDGYLLPNELSGSDAKMFKQMAHKAGLSVDQAKTFIDEVIMQERSQKAAYEASAKAVKDSWDKETQAMWGDPQTVAKKTFVAERAMKDLGGDKLTQVLEETGLKDNPVLKKVFAEIGTKYLYEHEVVAADKADTFGQSVEEKRELANSLRLDPAYYNAKDPRHKAVVAQVKKLEGVTW